MPLHAGTPRDPSWRVHVIVSIVVFLVVFVSPHAATGIWTGPLTVTTLQASNAVTDMTVDTQGLLITVDGSVGNVYRILPNGTRTTLASGLINPYGVAVDKTSGMIYVCVSNNHCIDSVSSSGMTTTVAGLCGTSGSADGVGTAARFRFPDGIVYYGSGLLYVCNNDGAIRKINISTMLVSTVVRSGSFNPYYLCVNRAGNTLYVTDYTRNIIVRVDLVPSTATMTTIAGISGTSGYVDGVGSNARFNYPSGIALNNDETMLYIADSSNYRIRSMRLNDSYTATLAGTGVAGFKDGPAMTAQFDFMVSLKWYCNGTSGECGLLVADKANSRVRVVSLSRSQSYSKTISNLTNKYKYTHSLTATRQATSSASLSGGASRTQSRTPSRSIKSRTLSPAVTSSSDIFVTHTPTTTCAPSSSRSHSLTTASTALSWSMMITESLRSQTRTTPPSTTSISTTSTMTDSSWTTSASCTLPTYMLESRTTSVSQPTNTNTAVEHPSIALTKGVEQLRDGIAAATPVLQYSVGAVSTSVMSISRMGAVSKIGSCRSSFSPPKGLLSSQIGGCGTPLTSSVAGEFARSDVVLGMSALLCVTAFLSLCCYLYSHALHTPFQDSAAALSMPSLLLPLWGAALPTGVSGMVVLGRNWEGCVGDGVLLVFAAVVVVVLPMALLVGGTTVMLRQLQIVPEAVTAVKEDTRCAPLQQVLRVALDEQWRWQPMYPTTTNVHLYGRLVVLQHRLLWYAALDAVVLVSVSALASAAVDLPLLTCQALGGAIVALLVLQLFVCVVGRPFTTPFDQVVAITTLALNVVGAALQLSLLSDASAAVLAAAVALDLLLLGVCGLKATLDFVALIAAARRRWGLLMAKQEMQTPQGQSLQHNNVDVDEHGAMRSLHLGLDDMGIPELLLEGDHEFEDVLEGVPGLDACVPMMTDSASAVRVNALMLAYAAMDGGLPWEDQERHQRFKEAFELRSLDRTFSP